MSRKIPTDMEARYRSTGSTTRGRDRQSARPASKFTANYVPRVMWPGILNHFGSDYTYHTAEGEEVSAVGVLIEGMDDEAISPGRYARFWVDMRDLPREPRSADWLTVGDRTYDVERVDATLYDIQRLVIRLSTEQWEPQQCSSDCG